MALIEVEEVSRIYDVGGDAELRVYALREVSVQIEAGEFVAVIGASGSGKSTLLNLLGCLDRPTLGRYRLDGVETTTLSNAERARIRNERIGFVFQSFNMLPRQTAVDNVALPLVYAGVSRRERRRRATEVLERVSLGERTHHRPNQLSGGQLQRVAIARALVRQPAILLADEPTGNLDSKTSREILDIFHELNAATGVTIVMVTHDPAVADLAPRALRFLDGRIVEDRR